MEIDPDLRRQRALAAWQSAVLFNLSIVLLAPTGFIAFPRPLQSALTAVRLFQITWSVLLLAVLYAQRQRPNREQALAIFALTLLPQLAWLWVVGIARESAGVGFEPFMRHKLLLLVLAELSPGEILVSTSVLIVLTFEAAIEYYVGDMRYSVNLSQGEPWATVAFTAAAIIIVFRRARLYRQMEALVLELRDHSTAARMAMVALAARDLLNTPLQTITLCLSMLEKENLELVARMRRAVARIAELNRFWNQHLPPETHPEAESFNASDILRH